MKGLSILIATVYDRQEDFTQLTEKLTKEILKFELSNYVEVLYIQDNKELSVGAKRQKLLEKATKDYIVFFDDDDWPYDMYVKSVFDAINHISNPDCIGINVDMTTNGANPQTCCHSLQYPEWKDKIDGWDYVRNVTHFNPVRRGLALQAGFKDIRFGEDKDYADRLTPLCKSELFIVKPLFHYRYSNKIQHNIKYGIK